MAYSTQKNLLHVAFMNERPQARCLSLEGVKLKTYASTPDERAWSASKEKQAQYLMDLVACRTYPYDGGDGPRGAAPCDPCSPNARPVPCDGIVPTVGADSLMDATVSELSKLEKLVSEKDDLKNQLQVSREKLRIYKEEKQTIDSILRNEHSPEMSCCFKKKIEQLKGCSKIDKNDENELLKILDSLCKREKAYRVLEAQVSYLRQLVEKLSTRVRLCSIKVEPEKSKDVAYLQCTVNNLRKEVKLLREQEDQRIKTETVSRGIQGGVSASDTDADNIARILAERNTLRDKCKRFAAIESKIIQWKRDSEQYQAIRQEACCALKEKDDQIQDFREEIEELQFKMRKLEKCCIMKDNKGESLCESIDCLKDENRCMREELTRCRCEMKRITMLQQQVQCMQDELCEKNCIINQYDMQYQQLLCVVEGLRSKAPVDIRGLQDVDSQTHMEELAASTRATLTHITKELESSKTDLETERRKSVGTAAQLAEKERENNELRGNLKVICNTIKETLETINLAPQPGEDCAAQVKRLGDLIIEVKRNNADSLAQNDAQSQALRDCQNKMKMLQDQNKELSATVSDLEAALQTAQSNFDEANKLIQDINKVKQRNDNLTSVLGAAEQEEFEACKKELEQQRQNNKALIEQLQNLQAALADAGNCRQQLEEERKKLRALLEENSNLQTSLEREKASKQELDKLIQQQQEKIRKQEQDLHEQQEKLNKQEQELKQALEKASKPSGSSEAPPPKPPVDKSKKKITQLRDNYEKEIEGHRMSNEVLRSSLTKLTTKMQNRSAADFEREFRVILDTFVDEICKWRCERTCGKLTRLQELCKRILDNGIEYLTYKELVYLHQQVSEAAAKLKPKSAKTCEPKVEPKCCKCSGNVCQVPTIPRDSEKKLMEKMAALERDIFFARENLRKLKEEDNLTDTGSVELETMRANTFRLNCVLKNDVSNMQSTRQHYAIQEDQEVPTKDRFGC